jgi:hypothetical protein
MMHAVTKLRTHGILWPYKIQRKATNQEAGKHEKNGGERKKGGGGRRRQRETWRQKNQRNTRTGTKKNIDTNRGEKRMSQGTENRGEEDDNRGKQRVRRANQRKTRSRKRSYTVHRKTGTTN